MITAQEMIAKVGKRKFVETATYSQPKQTGAWIQHRRRWGKGRTLMAYCQHGIRTVDNYEPTGLCKKCVGVVLTTGRHFEPYFNAGLGVMITSKGEERKIARSMGLREAG